MSPSPEINARNAAFNTIMTFEQARLGWQHNGDPNSTDPRHLTILQTIRGRSRNQAIMDGEEERTLRLTLVEPPPNTIRSFGPAETPFVAVLDNASVQFLTRPTEFDPADMNKLFAPALKEALTFAWRQRQERLKALVAKKTEKRLRKIFDQIMRRREETAELQVQQWENNLEIHRQRAREASGELDRYLKELRIIKGDRRRKKVLAAREAKTFLQLMPGVLVNIEVTDEKILCYTGPITIERPMKTFDMGVYRIELPLVEGSTWESIKIWADKPPYGDHQHPHVNGRGICCLGNMEQAVDDHLRRKEYVTLAVLLVEFLGTYNPGSPYYQLDESSYQECLEEGDGADVTNCADCDDTDCPHWSSRHDRCWAHHHSSKEYIQCLECRMCDFHERARQYCERVQLRARTAWNCISCIADCDNTGNHERCRSHHNGELCSRGCPQNECNHHPGTSRESTEEATTTADGDQDPEARNAGVPEGDGGSEEETRGNLRDVIAGLREGPIGDHYTLDGLVQAATNFVGESDQLETAGTVWSVEPITDAQRPEDVHSDNPSED